jgi:L-asparaginase
MTPRDWVLIAERISSNYREHDGFVVIHGTDTLSYTASALSFMFENLGKPIVMTGSQLPLSNSRTDAALNYGHAVMIAGHKATDLPLIPEVIVVFASRILRGCRTRKMSASAWTGFESPNAPALGAIGEHIKIYENQIRPAPAAGLALQLTTQLVPEVLDVSLYPGLTPAHLRSILSLDNVKGVVLRTYGTGNAPEDPDFLSALADGIAKEEKTVVNITQCPHGSVEMGLYAASVGLLDIGVISGLDMTPEAALTKLMVMLGNRVGDQIKLQMQINQRGEQSQNLFDLVYNAQKTLTERYSDYVQPDRRFDRDALTTAVVRIRKLRAELETRDGGDPAICVFMNAPKASLSDLIDGDHPRLILTIGLTEAAHQEISVAETLNRQKIKSAAGDGDIALTFVATPGVRFGFDELSLSLLTNA